MPKRVTKFTYRIRLFCGKHWPLLIISILFILLSLLVFLKIKAQAVKSQALEKQIRVTSQKLTDLKNQDQYKINQELKRNIKNIEDSFKSSLNLYQRILDIKAQKQDTQDLDKEFAQSLDYLSKLNYSSGAASLKKLDTDLKNKENQLAQAQSVAEAPQNVQASNSLPSGGFSVQKVSTGNGDFIVDIISADLNSTKVIVDTASGGDCGNDCPILPLSDYVSRNGAFAGINGSFFCPSEYPSCAGKTNSFDTLLMNKNKVYFNSSNNVYSTVPLVVFKDNWAKFFTQSLEWGRDTSIDSAIAMQPLLVFSGQNVYSGSGVDKYNSKGARGFVANKGSTIYIGDVLGATMDDAAKVMKALGVDNALNLDEGGSTALWYGGYKLGPGRNIPNAVLFVHK